MTEDVDLTLKTREQLLDRLAQLKKTASREGRPGELFTELFASQYEATREINLILIEIARRLLEEK
jgi:hypothetical protein